jgi:hypothetical protein
MGLGNLTVSTKKTKVMAVGGVPGVRGDVQLDGQALERVEQFVHLGSEVDGGGSVAHEVRRRIGMAQSAFMGLKNVLWKRREISVRTKMRVFRATVLSRLLYGCETWAVTAADVSRLEAFQSYCLRRILRVSWLDKVPNETVRSMCNQPVLAEILRQRRMQWLGHVQRMDGDVRVPKMMLWGRLSVGKRAAGGPKLRWADVCVADLRHADVLESWTTDCTDRPSWRERFAPGSMVTEREARRKMRKVSETERAEVGAVMARPALALGRGAVDSTDAAAVCLRKRPTVGERAQFLIPCSQGGCGRMFSRPQDESRHRCLTSRTKR